MKLGIGTFRSFSPEVSACLAIGVYSKLLDASLNGLLVLLSVIEILMSGMSASEDSAAAAALALRHFCDGLADDYFLLASRCILYRAHLLVASAVFPPLADGAMIGYNMTQVTYAVLALRRAYG